MIKRKKSRKVGLTVGGALIIYCIVLAVDIYRYSSTTDNSPSDAAIVLGAAVLDGRPSPVFEERIKHAINLYKEGRVRFIIFTGGVGKSDQQSESIIAADYAIENGVAANDTFCETSSKITFENLRGAKEIIEQQDLKRILVVSDPLHMRRSVMMAHDLGIDAYPSPTPTTRYIGFQSKIQFLLREVYFYGSYLIERPFVTLFEDRQKMTIQSCQ